MSTLVPALTHDLVRELLIKTPLHLLSTSPEHQHYLYYLHGLQDGVRQVLELLSAPLTLSQYQQQLYYILSLNPRWPQKKAQNPFSSKPRHKPLANTPSVEELLKFL